MRKIIIDAGHGGTDNGASGFGEREKDWTLEVSLYQYERFKELGVPVHLTRRNDETLESVPRTNRVKESGADICISNHFNAFNGDARGVETIHSIYADDKLLQ